MRHLRYWIPALLTTFLLWRLYVGYQAQRMWSAGQRDEALLTLVGNDPLWRACFHLGMIPASRSLGWLNTVGLCAWVVLSGLAWGTVMRTRRTTCDRR